MEEKDSRLIHQLVASLDRAYHRPSLLLWRSFFMGLASGTGASIGVAVVVGLVSLLVRHFGGIPVVGRWLIDLRNDLPKRN